MSSRGGKKKTEASFLRRRRMLALAVVVGVVIFHAPVMRSVYALLIVNEETEPCDIAVLLTGEIECYDAAADLLDAERVATVLVVDFEPRTVQIGAANSFGDMAVRAMKKRDVPEHRVERIVSTGSTAHEHVRQLDEQMRKKPETNCCVVVPATLSRYYRTVINDSLPTDRETHYRLLAVDLTLQKTRNGSDAWNWWKTRSGIKRVVNHGMRLAFVKFHGESRVDKVDHYEHLLAAARRK